MEQLEASTNIFGAPLIDDVVVVVISEMGRSPSPILMAAEIIGHSLRPF